MTAQAKQKPQWGVIIMSSVIGAILTFCITMYFRTSDQQMIKETAQDQKYDKILGAITNLETKVIAPIQTELAVTVKRVDLLENSRAKRKHNSDETSFNTSNGGSNK